MRCTDTLYGLGHFKVTGQSLRIRLKAFGPPPLPRQALAAVEEVEDKLHIRPGRVFLIVQKNKIKREL